MPLPTLWYLEYILDQNAMYVIFEKFSEDSSEKLKNSKERESCAEKSSPNSELGAILEVRVHQEGNLKVSHAHAYRALIVASSRFDWVTY